MRFPFQRARSLYAPEDAPAGGSGGGAAAPASPGVRSPAPPAGDPNPFPLTFGGGSAPAGGAPQPGAAGGDVDELDAAVARGENAIPHGRVKEMRGRWESAAVQRGRAEAEQALLQQFAPILEELTSLREVASQLNPESVRAGVAESILAGLGVKKPGAEPKQPQYLTVEDFNRKLDEHRQSLTRETQHREDMQQASMDLQASKSKHAQWFTNFPIIEELAAAVWSTPYAMKNRVRYAQIVDSLVSQLEKGIGDYNKAYADGKRRQANELPITPGATPAPGRKPEKVDHSTEGTAARALAFLEERLGE